jgi:hypothetical protein
VRIASTSLVLAILHGSALVADAQPWVPPPGQGTATLTYQNYYVTGHFSITGTRTINGATHSKALVANVDVGLPRAFGVSIELPYIRSKYTGPGIYFVGGFPTTPGPLDDRSYHGAFQDLHIEGRRMFAFRHVALAPLAGLTVPTHAYETRGEAVPGRHRTDFQFGASAGTEFSPSTYAHARYALAASEKTEGFPSVRSNIDLEAGYDVIRRCTFRGLASWQVRHRGPTLPTLFAHGWDTHDRFIVSNYTNIGGGVSFRIKKATELSGTWVATVKGNNGAHIARMLAISLTREFGGGLKGLGGSATISSK